MASINFLSQEAPLLNAVQDHPLLCSQRIWIINWTLTLYAVCAVPRLLLLLFKSFEMSKIPLIIDAWLREAQEASRWLEDLESRIKHERLIHPTSVHSARSKLLELGAKLDRLESLLRNLPAKPILTDEDVEYRWKMLKDIQLRTKSLVSSISAVPSQDWPRDFPAADSEECNVSPDSYDQDQTKTSYPRDSAELLKPLVSDAASRSEGHAMPMFWVWKACSTIFLFLALAALLFLIALLCTAF